MTKQHIQPIVQGASVNDMNVDNKRVPMNYQKHITPLIQVSNNMKKIHHLYVGISLVGKQRHLSTHFDKMHTAT